MRGRQETLRFCAAPVTTAWEGLATRAIMKLKQGRFWSLGHPKDLWNGKQKKGQKPHGRLDATEEESSAVHFEALSMDDLSPCHSRAGKWTTTERGILARSDVRAPVQF